MPHSIVIFGASGDLTSRKLIPALLQLFQRDRLPPETHVIGIARSEFSDEAWRAELAKSTAKFLEQDFDSAAWSQFEQRLYYRRGNIESRQDYEKLAEQLTKL